MNAPNELIKEHLRQLPTNPGVYIFKDAEGTIIYVGKSNSLENRVKSY
ncbi:MAG: GIY-YIG nuclease family protein, partial [Dehalococcoidales bacterium]|nr:GIY-YIG nuclease family protein [Dehalococcoidales bacterium]